MKMIDAIIYVSGDDNWNQGIDSSKEMCQKERLTSNSSDEFTMDVPGEIIYVDWKKESYVDWTTMKK